MVSSYEIAFSLKGFHTKDFNLISVDSFQVTLVIDRYELDLVI